MTTDLQVHFYFSWKGKYNLHDDNVTSILLQQKNPKEKLWMNINRRRPTDTRQMLVINREGEMNVSNGLEGSCHTLSLERAKTLKVYAKVFKEGFDEPDKVAVRVKTPPEYQPGVTYVWKIGIHKGNLEATIQEEGVESDETSSSEDSILSLSEDSVHSDEAENFSDEVFSSSFDMPPRGRN